VPADTLILPKSNQEQRIDYQGFYNPQTNQIIIMGTAKPQPLGGFIESEPKIADGGLFWDTERVNRGPNAGAFVAPPVTIQLVDLRPRLKPLRNYFPLRLSDVGGVVHGHDFGDHGLLINSLRVAGYALG
jgi:hypothetical protein